jgi:hypothetical protein
MGKKQDTSTRKPRLKKESLRNLDSIALSPDELAQVAGGYKAPTCPCRTQF